VLPSVARDVCLVTVAGRRPSPPLATFMQAVRTYPWPSPLVADNRDRISRDPASA
jgi:LysR family hydrogen peroxide-inducible transcriptional activator